MSTINTKHKDRLFCYIFGREENKKWTLDLFNAMNDSTLDNPDEMDDDFQIKAFLISHKAEVQDMLFVNYDEEETMNAFKKEFYEDGKADGIEEGKVEGKADKANEDMTHILKAAEDGLITNEVAEILVSKIKL